ncbi:hypothetical protein DSM03_10194 [Leeuwenhoekiella aestuarii]|uniref:hypothetical protein n=1 Tax=Leeuwenhoekiella aestuarii TaxID=2249426 RepID=UPI000FFF016E|nr:hypothetical protein [Leeuwenhoekiella aestuarii]RXG18730.1 hypothetical protein DSM03_10194 [Leeuwenhoekiella aestuarii]
MSNIKAHGDKSICATHFKDSELSIFKDFGIVDSTKRFASRSQMSELYQVPRKTLADNIRNLKQDGLINPAKSRHIAKDGKVRVQELFTLNEVVAIGFRLRSDVAIKLQSYAIQLLSEKITRIQSAKEILELELSHYSSKSDIKDLYR